MRWILYRFRNDDRELPVMWHQTLLALCQRYKNDLNDKQKHAIRELVKVSSSHLHTSRFSILLKNIKNIAG